MEDQTPKVESSKEDEPKTDKKTRESSFLESWLKLNNHEDLKNGNEKKKKEEDDTEEDEETSMEKKPSRKKRDKFIRSLKKLLFLPGSEPKSNTDKLQKMTSINELNGSKIGPAEQSYQYARTIERNTTTDTEEDKSVEARYAQDNAEILPAAYIDHKSPEHIGKIVRRVEKESTGALAAIEALSRSREARTKKEISKMKKEAKSAKKERQEMQEHQKAFEKRLDLKIKRTEKIKETKHGDIVQAPEIRLQSKEYKEPTTPKEIHIDSKEYKELVEHQPHEKPEVVLERVEVAAEHNIPLESLYERRHELKDDAFRQPLAKTTTLSSIGQKHKIKTPSVSLKDPMASLKQPASPQNQDVASQSTLYKQAVVGGFWTAIVLLIAILTLVLLS